MLKLFLFQLYFRFVNSHLNFAPVKRKYYLWTITNKSGSENNKFFRIKIQFSIANWQSEILYAFNVWQMMRIQNKSHKNKIMLKMSLPIFPGKFSLKIIQNLFKNLFRTTFNTKRMNISDLKLFFDYYYAFQIISFSVNDFD